MYLVRSKHWADHLPWRIEGRILKFLRGLSILTTVLASAVLCATSVSANGGAGYFQSSEFPNLLVPEKYQSGDGKIPDPVVAESKNLVAAALKSAFDRYVYPVVPDGEPEVRRVRLFSYLKKSTQDLDRNLRLVAIGGDVRLGFQYLYRRIYLAKRIDPTVESFEVLKQIASESGDVRGLEFHGVGSDIDLSYITESTEAHKINERLLRIVNSAQEHYGLSESDHVLKRGFLRFGDVKPYAKHIERTIPQGGLTVDFLGFDIETGQFIEPPSFGSIVDDFIRGQINYIKADQGVRTGPTKTVRGIRPFLELPWVQYLDDRVLASELRLLNQDVVVKGASALIVKDAKAIEQFGKIVRNSFAGGAHNRLYRARPNSLDQQIAGLVEQVSEIVGYRLVPEFLDHDSLEDRSLADRGLNGLPSELLMSVQDFESRYTDKGWMYHGTPSVENLMSILRKGLYISDGEAQGRANRGRAAYATGLYQVAMDRAEVLSHEGYNPVILPLKAMSDGVVNIIDLDRMAGHPALKVFREKAFGLGLSLPEYLAKYHSIDIVISHYILILNSAAIDIPNNVSVLVSAMESMFSLQSQPLAQRLVHFNDYIQMFQYVYDLGEVERPASAKSVVRLMGEAAASGVDVYSLLSEGKSFFKSWYANSRDFQKVLKTLAANRPRLGRLVGQILSGSKDKGEFSGLIDHALYQADSVKREDAESAILVMLRENNQDMARLLSEALLASVDRRPYGRRAMLVEGLLRMRGLSSGTAMKLSDVLSLAIKEHNDWSGGAPERLAKWTIEVMMDEAGPGEARDLVLSALEASSLAVFRVGFFAAKDRYIDDVQVQRAMIARLVDRQGRVEGYLERYVSSRLQDSDSTMREALGAMVQSLGDGDSRRSKVYLELLGRYTHRSSRRPSLSCPGVF